MPDIVGGDGDGKFKTLETDHLSTGGAQINLDITADLSNWMITGIVDNSVVTGDGSGAYGMRFGNDSTRGPTRGNLAGDIHFGGNANRDADIRIETNNASGISSRKNYQTGKLRWDKGPSLGGVNVGEGWRWADSKATELADNPPRIVPLGYIPELTANLISPGPPSGAFYRRTDLGTNGELRYKDSDGNITTLSTY